MDNFSSNVEIIKKSTGLTIAALIALLILALFCLVNGIIIFSGIFLLSAILLFFNYRCNYIALEANGITVRNGFLGTTKKFIPYNKINNVDSNSLRASVIIFTGNDSDGIRFDSLDNPQIVQQKILNRLSSN